MDCFLVEMGLYDGHFGQFFKIFGESYKMYARSLSSRFQACHEKDVSLVGHCFLLRNMPL